MFHFNHYWKLKGKLTKKQTLTWEHQNFRNLKAPKGIDDKKKQIPIVFTVKLHRRFASEQEKDIVVV